MVCLWKIGWEESYTFLAFPSLEISMYRFCFAQVIQKKKPWMFINYDTKFRIDQSGLSAHDAHTIISTNANQPSYYQPYKNQCRYRLLPTCSVSHTHFIDFLKKSGCSSFNVFDSFTEMCLKFLKDF